MADARISLRVWRQPGDGRERAGFQTFEVTTDPQRDMVLDLIERAWAEVDRTLVFRHACHHASCGTCAVLVDGEPVLSCLMLGIEAENSEIVTVEGMTQNGKPHPLQKAFADLGAAQCGYCIPGVLLTAKALLDTKPHPTRDEIRQALAGNLCRCTGYTKILQAVELAAKENA